MKFVSRLIFGLIISVSTAFGQAADSGLTTLHVYRSDVSKTPFKKGLKPSVDDHIDFYGLEVRPLLTGIKRRAEIRKIIREDTRKLINEMFRSNKWLGFRDASRILWSEFDRVNLEDLLADIEKSEFAIRDGCRDVKGVAREASAQMNRPGSEICFDVGKILTSEKQWPENWIRAKVAALVVHEALHHFGIWDANNLISEMLAMYFELWLNHEIPEPEAVTVPTSIAKLRSDFLRSSGMDLDRKKTHAFECRYEHRPESGTELFHYGLEELVHEWFKQGFSLMPSGLIENRFEVISKTDDPERRITPKYFLPSPNRFFSVFMGSSFAAFNSWVTEESDGLTTKRFYGVAEEVRVYGRFSEEGDLLIELAEVPNAFKAKGTFLPASLYLDQNVVGYARCKAN